MSTQASRSRRAAPGPALAKIWARHRDDVLTHVAALEDAVAALMESRLSGAARRAAERDAHRLAGSAGTFGFTGASESALRLESVFAGTDPVPPPQVLVATEEVVALRLALDDTAGPAPASAGLHTIGQGGRRLLVAVGDGRRREQIAAAAAARGFDVVGPAVGGLPAGAERPVAAVVDLGLPEDGGLRLLPLLAAAEPPIPTLALTTGDRLEARVEAARAGALGCLEAAAPPDELLDAVEALLSRTSTADTTVLVLDDDPAVLGVIGALLETAGLRMLGTEDPARFWAALDETRPDLVIMDMDMPELRGDELCRVLRADSRWADLPILFLTAHSDPGTVAATFAAGADDFLAKPFSGPDLLDRIQNRLERTRQLRRPAGADAFREANGPDDHDPSLSSSLERAPRRAGTFSTARVDLDDVEQSVDVLVVEDDDALAELLEHALTTRGLRSRHLPDGNDAVRQLTGCPPALHATVVLLDVDLPGLNGLGVLRQMAAAGTLAGTRVIMLTARSGEPEVLEALELGAFDHVAKPFSVPVLMQRVHGALES